LHALLVYGRRKALTSFDQFKFAYDPESNMVLVGQVPISFNPLWQWMRQIRIQQAKQQAQAPPICAK